MRRCAALQAEKNGIPWREEVKRFESDPSFQARPAAPPLGLQRSFCFRFLA